MTTNRKADKIVALVVTYNRLPLLKNTVAALQVQTTPLSGIIVVNNGSTDGTGEWLSGQTGLEVVTQENVGGAGGFHTGVRQAFEKGADWVWLMDDDVLPDRQCLQNMLRWSFLSLCLNPVHLSVDGELSDEERWFDATSCNIINLFNSSYRQGKEIWFRNLGSFEGMLIHRHVIEKIGFPDSRFFIAHDDLIYGYLANRYTNVAVVADAVMERQPAQKSNDSHARYQYYYAHRNLWILEEYAQQELPQFRHYRRRRIQYHFFYTVYKIFFVDKPPGKIRALRYLFQAYRDYRNKKSGIKDD